MTELAAEDRGRLEQILRQHGVPLSEQISQVRRWSMACPALPTCGLAITDSERALPGMIDQLEVELRRLGLDDERFTIRMTGCPNGCARPYNSDVGLVGKAKGKYTVFVGGRTLGDRLGFIHKDLVPADEVVPTLVALLDLLSPGAKRRRVVWRFLLSPGQRSAAGVVRVVVPSAAGQPGGEGG